MSDLCERGQYPPRVIALHWHRKWSPPTGPSSSRELPHPTLVRSSYSASGLAIAVVSHCAPPSSNHFKLIVWVLCERGRSSYCVFSLACLHPDSHSLQHVCASTQALTYLHAHSSSRQLSYNGVIGCCRHRSYTSSRVHLQTGRPLYGVKKWIIVSAVLLSNELCCDRMVFVADECLSYHV